jgi:hypothetical protein
MQIPFVVEDLGHNVLFSGAFTAAPGQDVVVMSSRGGTLHAFDPRTSLIRVVLPTDQEIGKYDPQEPEEGTITLSVESADSARKRTDEEMEDNRVAGTIKPQGSPAEDVEYETIQVQVSTPDPTEPTEPTETTEPTQPAETEPPLDLG